MKYTLIQVDYRLASKIGHTYENVNKAMKDSINVPNLDITGKKTDFNFRWYVSH